MLVPNSWNVRIKTTHILGGTDNHTIFNHNPNAPVLTITGSVILGGIDIK